jgi:putative tricarboxylic transport membrane protein
LRAIKSSAALFSFLIIALGVLVFVTSRRFPELPEGHPGPGLFPTLLGGGLIFCGLLLLVSALWSVSNKSIELKGKWTPVLLILAMLAGFPFLVNQIGFLATISIALFLTGMLMRLNILHAGLTALITTGFIYLIFDLILHVPL